MSLYVWSWEFPLAPPRLTHHHRPYAHGTAWISRSVRSILGWSSEYRGSWLLSYQREWRVDSLRERSIGQCWCPRICRNRLAPSAALPCSYSLIFDWCTHQVEWYDPRQSQQLDSFRLCTLVSRRSPSRDKERFLVGCKVASWCWLEAVLSGELVPHILPREYRNRPAMTSIVWPFLASTFLSPFQCCRYCHLGGTSPRDRLSWHQVLTSFKHR